MAGFEPRTSGVGSDRSANWATTIQSALFQSRVDTLLRNFHMRWLPPILSFSVLWSQLNWFRKDFWVNWSRNGNKIDCQEESWLVKSPKIGLGSFLRKLEFTSFLKWAISGLFFFIFVYSIHSCQYRNVRY